MSRSIEERLDRIEQKQRVIDRNLNECLFILRSKLIPVFESSSRRESQCKRTAKCRAKKRDKLRDRREFTTENNPLHSLTSDINVMMRCRPSLHDSMMDRLKLLVGKCSQPDNWFRMLAGEHPRRAVVFLVSLYNHCSWVPWVMPSGNQFRIFVDWRPESEPKIARYRLMKSGQVLMKASPPREWTDMACNGFCESWIWKVYTVIYKFVEELLDFSDLVEFKKLTDVMCDRSGYVVYKDYEWAPMHLADQDEWNRMDALKAYGLVSPRLKILREAFVKGLTTNVETFFTEPV